MLDFTKNNEEFSDVGQTMTAKEVASLFGKSITTIYNWRDKKLIHPIYSCPTNRGEIYSKTEILSLYKSGFRN